MSAPPDRPELRAVPESPPTSTEPATEKRRPWLPIALLVLLLVASAGYLYESQRASTLEGQVGALQTELQATQADLRAHEQRMQVVRGHVADLAGRMELLQQAVEGDPAQR